MDKDTAMDLALKALENFKNPEINALKSFEQCEAAITAIKQARSAPVQEPVAWMDASGDIYKHELWPDWNPPHTPLYTTPLAAQQDIQRLTALVRAQQITIDKLEVQRKWTGLTDRERDQFFKYVTMPDLVKAIEAKLKEKNT